MNNKEHSQDSHKSERKSYTVSILFNDGMEQFKEFETADEAAECVGKLARISEDIKKVSVVRH